jgi:2'-5' RNA ligase
MRLFVAVVPPLEVVEDLSEFAEPRREYPDDDIRWATDEHWHITLAFLGDVPDWKTDELGGCGGRSMSPSGSGFSTRTPVRSGPPAACT